MCLPIRPLRHLAVLLTTGLLVVGLAGCGQGSDSAPLNSAGQTAAAAAPAKSASPAAPRDLSRFDVCAVLPAAAVAGSLGSTVDRTVAESTMSTYAIDCTYTIDRGEGMEDYTIVYLYSHEMWAPMIDDTAERLTGLGDDAYLTSSGSDGFDTVHVLVNGDFLLDVRANSSAQAHGLAEVAIARLTGTSG